MTILGKMKNRVFPSQQSRRVKPWFKINGDKTLRLNYDLNNDSMVFDLGGYEGQWTSDIFSKYQCEIYLFEPFLNYTQNIKQRFQKNNKIKIFGFGLGKEDKRMLLYSNDDASSVFKKEGSSFEIEIRKASSFLKDNNIESIDLMKVNIEGGEYDLLDELIEDGSILMIKNLQIQFHDFVPNAYARMKAIHTSLSATHTPTYQYEFVWENWELKK